MLAKVQGPPPNVVHTIVPVGTLGSVAASMPPVSKEVMAKSLVKPLVAHAAGSGQRVQRRSGSSRGCFTRRAGCWLTMRQGCADRPVEQYQTCSPAVVPLPGSADVMGRLAMLLATV